MARPARDDRRGPLRPLRRAVTAGLVSFLQTENAGAKLLAVASLAALGWVNSPLSETYESVWSSPLPTGVPLAVELPDLRHWVNDGLMTLFFLVVGLEIKREIVAGELGMWRKAALPVVAAVGGMVVPALIYAALNAGTPAAPGWGIPMATDIAFAVALVALVLPRAPRGLVVFLLSLAIVDDIGAIVVIAVFYAGHVDVGWFVAGAVVLLSFRVALRRAPVPGPATYALVGVMLWLATLKSGVHPAIAGAVLGLVLPARGAEDDTEPRSPTERLEASIHPWVSFAVVPVFALANAGVRLDLDGIAAAVTSRPGLGIVLGLVAGKIAGVTSLSWLAVKLRVADRPEGMGWAHVIAAASVAGIGFTVALFVNDLAFGDSPLGERAKLAVLVASLVAALLGAMLLKIAERSEAHRLSGGRGGI